MKEWEILLDPDIHNTALNNNDSSKFLEDGAVIEIVKKKFYKPSMCIFSGQLTFKIIFWLSKNHNKFR